MSVARRLMQLLADPAAHAAVLLNRQWSDVLRLARREFVLAPLAARLTDCGLLDAVPEALRPICVGALQVAHQRQTKLTAEIAWLEDALAALPCPVVLLKGGAYLAAGLEAAKGRIASDVDLLVERSWLGAVEAALAERGWLMDQVSEYDRNYYLTWMHELPPIRHVERQTLVDVHHTILPLTARLTPDAAALVRDSQAAPGRRFRRLSDADMVLHAAAHMFYDGDFTLPIRGLWDLDRLLRQFAQDPAFWPKLAERAALHHLGRPLAYALETLARYLATPIPADALARAKADLPGPAVYLAMRELLEEKIGRMEPGIAPASERIASLALYVRSHWIKMPPPLLARHLWTKWRTKTSD
jgi:hypothetical protein